MAKTGPPSNGAILFFAWASIFNLSMAQKVAYQMGMNAEALGMNEGGFGVIVETWQLSGGKWTFISSLDARAFT